MSIVPLLLGGCGWREARKACEASREAVERRREVLPERPDQFSRVIEGADPPAELARDAALQASKKVAELCQ
ncbi:MAG: hypothetical protein FJ090_11075 [Deltaproteobacteria bacterium]|nr:hypothetical protein [Deltaproteobacteria bacterium]